MPKSDFETLKARLSEYLRQQAATGPPFVKSRAVAADIDVSVKRVGAAIAALATDSPPGLTITRRGGDSDGTTWHIQQSRD